jgi:predicted RecB family nuclease
VFEVNFHALLTTSRSKQAYIPILFLHTERIRIEDRLLLAFYGSILWKSTGLPPPMGRIIYGERQTNSKIALDNLLPRADKLIFNILELQKGIKPPSICLNRNCTICEYKAVCYSTALGKDDLSLLRVLTSKEISKFKKRGIFTVTQLAHTLRLRRNRKQSTKRRFPHKPELKALAVTNKKTYVIEVPKLIDKSVDIYFDVEGTEDQNFYYLIGAIICNGGINHRNSFWANTKDDENKIWELFLEVLKNFEDYNLFHYGSYEKKFVKTMVKRYGPNSDIVDRIENNMVNVLSEIYSKVYFPTHSNDLKSIASHLGFKWSSNNASGIQSLVWRYKWHQTQDADLKKKLVTYNYEDCLALKTVTETLKNFAFKEKINTNDLRLDTSFKFGKINFFFPELNYVNRCAYFDYQRSRVYLKTSKDVNKSLKRKRLKKPKVKINKEIDCGRPQNCIFCGSNYPIKYGKYFQVVYDLKLFDGGIKRWVIKYNYCRFFCKKCKKTFFHTPFRCESFSKYGHKLMAWIVYQNICLLNSYLTISDQINEVFGININRNTIAHFKKRAAIYYSSLYKKIKKKILAKDLIHVDETPIKIRGDKGYIWVLTNMEEVFFSFSNSREGSHIQDILANFKGVLISDFYAVYDSIDCVQQKCLIHLIRDFNDDLYKNPFDEEYKELAMNFTNTLVPIIKTVEIYGLKRRYLRKHKKGINRFYKTILKTEFKSEVAEKYKTRLNKYKDKLFNFIDYDGIPWNNNNAENAIKRLAMLRRTIGGSSTPEGIKDYMILFSISETLRRKNYNILEFFASGIRNIDYL